jgi:membrane protease YdiL (CAAX protease family)
MNLNVENPLKRYPLVFFFILAYGIAWIPAAYGLATGKDFLLGISFFAPAISAAIMTAANENKPGMQALVSRLFLWQVNFKWYLIAILAPIAFELLAFLTHQLLGDTAPSLRLIEWIQTFLAQLPWLIIIPLFLVLLSAGEELGWRGYALPRLQARFGSAWASIILGLLWGFWHLPAFRIRGSPQYGLPIPGYILAAIGYSLIYTCIYNGAKGSVLLVSLYHAASNLVLMFGNAIYPKIISNLYLSLPALAILVSFVVLLSGSNGFVGRQFISSKNKA